MGIKIKYIQYNMLIIWLLTWSMPRAVPSCTRSRVCSVFPFLRAAVRVVRVMTQFLLGGQGYISVVPTTASVCNRVFHQFISRLPKTRSVLRPPRDPLETSISRGLELLAVLAGDPSISERDPLSPMSFSRISAAVQQLQVENYMAAARDARSAFSPLGSDGRPMRK
jgi:hypothetical protein